MHAFQGHEPITEVDLHLDHVLEHVFFSRLRKAKTPQFSLLRMFSFCNACTWQHRHVFWNVITAAVSREVSHGVPERGQLPVQHCHDLQLVGVEDQIVQPASFTKVQFPLEIQRSF